MKVFFDIETIPSQNEKLIERLKLKADESFQVSVDKICAKYKKQDTIDSHVSALGNNDSIFDEMYRKTALDGGFGEICTIAFNKDDHLFSVTRKKDESERDLIGWFFNSFMHNTGQVQFIGHNIRHFDLRFIWHRCLVLGIEMPLDFIAAVNSRKNDWLRVWDTQTYWCGAFNSNMVSVDTLCNVFNIPSPKNNSWKIDGSKVWDFYKRGDYDIVNSYCELDVIAEKEIAIRQGVNN